MTVGNLAIQRLLRTAGHAQQPKLVVNSPRDAYEQEAERMAQAVISGRAARVAAGTGAAPRLQRCACGGTCSACQTGEEELQRKAEGVADGPAPSIVHTVLAAPGRPLEPSTRTFMEVRFGADFSGVRVHTGSRAAESARAVGAHAYTVGRDVVFGADQYAPGTVSGQRLLAHELTHVLQQDSGRVHALQRHSCRPGEGPPAAEPPITEEAGPHPLVYRGTSQRRSRRPAVGDAQELLNRFLDRLAAGNPPCKDGADLERINRLRGTLNEDPLEVDCRFGPNTETATIMFQRCVFPERPEEWDGKIGPKTWAELVKLRPIPTPTPPPPATPTPAASCVAGIPRATPTTCEDRNKGYCDARTCFPHNPWLGCACTVSEEICQAINGFLLDISTLEGAGLSACISFPPPPNVRAIPPTTRKGRWFRSTNHCIWGHWRTALLAIHDPSAPVPGGLTREWATAVGVCRTHGAGSSACCAAHVEAEQHAIDLCGPYDSADFGRLPTDVPQAPICSAVVGLFASPPFTGDFGVVADRIAYGNTRCGCV